MFAYKICLEGTVRLLTYSVFRTFSFGGWSEWAIGQFMRPHTEIMEKQELVTRGPYSRIRRPTYTGTMLMALALALLFLHAVPIIGVPACFGIAHKKTVLEEELLASEDGSGQAYRDYMSKTGRFLPRL